MRATLRSTISAALAIAAIAAMAETAAAQMPSVLYTWDGRGNPLAEDVENWARSFGVNTATVSVTTPGELTIQETGAGANAGTTFAFADGANRVRESSVAANGGLDLTGLDWLEFDIGHNGSGPINVQFYTQAASGTGPSNGYSFMGLGPDLAITPGIATYQVPLAGLPPDQLVYIRQFGVQVRDHAAIGNVTWTLREVRSGGTPLTVRDLITHTDTSIDGGLQGAIVNFDNTAVAGNDGGQNQSGLSHNPSGTGSLQWTDLGGGPGAALTWGNGTAWAGNGFNNRTTDLSGYTEMIVRMSANDPDSGGGTVGVSGMFYTDGFNFRSANGAGAQLPIDGQFHDLKFDITGIPGMDTTELTGINVHSHAQDLVMNVDNIRFRRVEYQENRLFSWENSLEGWTQGPEPGHTHSIVAMGATHGSTALQIDRRGSEPVFLPGSTYNTTDPGVIATMVPLINEAAVVAFDVTFQSYVSELISPTFTNFYVQFDDHNGGIYQAETSNININAANPAQTVTLRIPIENFLDPTEGSTKSLAADGLLESTNNFSIRLITNTDDGAVYQIDNFRVLTEATSDPADFNGDMMVDAEDFAAWKAAFGVNSNADADDDGDSDGADFLAWQRAFGTGVQSLGAAAAVPEPSACVIAALLALSAIRRRR